MRSRVIRSKSDGKLHYTPPLHADEIGLTSDKYITLNESVTMLPLKITISSMSQQVRY